MRLINEENISRSIIYVFIVIMSLMVFSISYIYVKKTSSEFDNEMKIFVEHYYDTQKELLKKEVGIIFDILKYNESKFDKEKEQKAEAVRLMHNISFQAQKSNYFFVYDIFDFRGGDEFARLIVNPNRPDLLGTIISTNYEDIHGKKFRQEFLDEVRATGESYTQYAYKKPFTNSINEKLAYYKLYPKWNWVIATGVYLDDIDKLLEEKKVAMKTKVRKQIIQTVLLFLLFLSFAILFSYFVSEIIEEYFQNYKKTVKSKSEALELLNETLENRVHEEIERRREQEQILIQKSKFIALGEMISNIAHQWRQPLSELSSLFMAVKFRHGMNKLDDEYMGKKSKEAENLIEYMSHTIDDFRNFFMPKKEKQTFLVSKAVESVMTIIGKALVNNEIKITIKVRDDLELTTYLNEYEQVMLNLISNAKDILMLRDIKNPHIHVYTSVDEYYVRLIVEDNGGGVLVEPKSKIFEPYFSTKKDSDGTGLGLYMSKMIIEKNINGKLIVNNTKEGAKFEVCIPGA